MYEWMYGQNLPISEIIGNFVENLNKIKNEKAISRLDGGNSHPRHEC